MTGFSLRSLRGPASGADDGFAPSRHACRGPRWLAWALALVLAHGAADPARAGCADLALVLAIDGSGSVTTDDFLLQVRGYAGAFRSPRVLSALAAAGTVEVGVVVWGDTEVAPQVLPLARLDGPDAVEALARRLEFMPRRVYGNTGIGRAVSTAIDMIVAPDVCATRRVVNLSGDGPETLAPRPRNHIPLAAVRQRAGDLGITINALAIRTDVPDLDDWYRTRLISGPDAFVLGVEGFDSFATAVITKLVREISPPQLALASTGDDPGPDRVPASASR